MSLQGIKLGGHLMTSPEVMVKFFAGATEHFVRLIEDGMHLTGCNSTPQRGKPDL